MSESIHSLFRFTLTTRQVLLYAVLLPGTLSLASTSFADTQSNGDHLQIPVASQAADKQHIDRPTTGLTGQRVADLFGEPLSATTPVGEPPISRWEYADFYVYFEYDRVIQSVLKHRTPVAY